MKITEPKNLFTWRGVPGGEGVVCHQKRYKDVMHLYKQKNQLDGDTVMYTVYSLPEKPAPGNLLWGLSLLHPVMVGNECNMTRGHFHKNLACEEYYWGMSGSGLLMLMDATGYCWAEKVYPGSLHRIDGHWAHRLINTSDQDLNVVCCWGADAGHDYERIETMPFPYRVGKINGAIVVRGIDEALL